MASSYGNEFNYLWPQNNPKFNSFGLDLIKKCLVIQKPKKTKISDVINESEKFSQWFPIETCRIKSQPKNRYEEIEKQLNSAYPVIHERVLWLYLKFLENKINFGSKIEQEVYNGIDLCDFVQRLLSKRCITFMNSCDTYLLIDGSSSGSGDFTKIGTDKEEIPLILANCLSYDEMKLSAFLSVSSFTEFLNDGNRNNRGIIEADKSIIEESGVVTGLIGARFEKENFMEFEDIIITPEQNFNDNGYGSKNKLSETNLTHRVQLRKLWNEFYDEEDFLYDDVTKRDGDKRFSKCSSNNSVFDNLVMKKRNTISFDTLLLESEARAAAIGKQAYIHVVGIGLGVWEIASQQTEIFLLTFGQRIKALLPQLNHVSYIHFSWFSIDKCGDLEDGKFFDSSSNVNGGIKIFISKRNPANKITLSDNCVAIVSYAWDSNALPGNEFWVKSLSASGDPAAACSTLITELHNPHINKNHVNGRNLHIASEKYGVIHISDYAKNVISLK